MKAIGFLIGGLLFATATIAGAQGCPVNEFSGKEIPKKGQEMETTGEMRVPSTFAGNTERAVFGLG